MSRPLRSGRRTSRTRHAGTSGRSLWRKACAEEKVHTSSPTERNSRSRAVQIEGSSSTTKISGRTSFIAASCPAAAVLTGLDHADCELRVKRLSLARATHFEGPGFISDATPERAVRLSRNEYVVNYRWICRTACNGLVELSVQRQ